MAHLRKVGRTMGSVFSLMIYHIAYNIRIPGSITSLKTLGQFIIILNSYEDAVELLERKSSIYSGRPAMVSARNASLDQITVLVHDGDTVREYRRLMAKIIGTKQAMQQFHGLIETETQNFLRRVLFEPDRVQEFTRKFVSSFFESHFNPI